MRSCAAPRCNCPHELSLRTAHRKTLRVVKRVTFRACMGHPISGALAGFRRLNDQDSVSRLAPGVTELAAFQGPSLPALRATWSADSSLHHRSRGRVL
jgi:hypothetical protein